MSARDTWQIMPREKMRTKIQVRRGCVRKRKGREGGGERGRETLRSGEFSFRFKRPQSLPLVSSLYITIMVRGKNGTV